MGWPKLKDDADNDEPAARLSVFADEPDPERLSLPRRRVLVLYDHHWTHVKTIAHYLESFHRFSRHDFYFTTSFGKCLYDLDYFDAVIVHYSVRTCHPGHLSKSYEAALARYRGLKVSFVQDEYEATDALCDAFERLGINVVFTCVPSESVPRVYSPTRFARVRFVNVLTGYVPLDIFDVQAAKPMRERSIVLGYRGRRIGWWYGDLGQEKLVIGQRMKAICAERNIAADIAWEEHDRIYGDDWFKFLANCKATLGTESGANVFDRDDSLSLAVQRELIQNPNATYQNVHEKYLRELEGQVVMNQISPKVFEAIACRTALVLFEGRYSDVLKPHEHFIPLKKDFSNVDEVLARLADDDFLEAMADRAYRDIVASGRYSYEAFIDFVDRTLEESWQDRPSKRETSSLPVPPCDAFPAFREAYRRSLQDHFVRRTWAALPEWARRFLRPVVDRQRWKNLWLRCPGFVRKALRPVFSRVKSLLKGE
jgi:hypothetical protein